mmetsp:Transcript_19607/g.35002  ORF Transcript_19607/g.35002 Transcript_19607/m.35002 type:complete len:202 (+) Transcript_19607:278-883(+)
MLHTCRWRPYALTDAPPTAPSFSAASSGTLKGSPLSRIRGATRWRRWPEILTARWRGISPTVASSTGFRGRWTSSARAAMTVNSPKRACPRGRTCPTPGEHSLLGHSPAYLALIPRTSRPTTSLPHPRMALCWTPSPSSSSTPTRWITSVLRGTCASPSNAARQRTVARAAFRGQRWTSTLEARHRPPHSIQRRCCSIVFM